MQTIFYILIKEQLRQQSILSIQSTTAWGDVANYISSVTHRWTMSLYAYATRFFGNVFICVSRYNSFLKHQFLSFNIFYACGQLTYLSEKERLLSGYLM